MPADPLVSVLVPLFNKEGTVVSTIESALAQTHSNIEVIVLDDGSTDRSLEQARTLADQRVSVMTRENRGANATRNELLRRSSGEFVQFLDADDWIHPNKFARQLEAIGQDLPVAFSFVDEVRGVESNRMPGYRSGDDLETFIAHHGIVTVGPLHRRASLESIGGFDETLVASQEYELHLRLVSSGAWYSVAAVEEVLARWNRGPTSTSSDDLVVYREKARALAVQGRATKSGHLADECAAALMNAGRHLARGADVDGASDAFRTAVAISRAADAALPRRWRLLARAPRVLSRVEHAEHFIRRGHASSTGARR